MTLRIGDAILASQIELATSTWDVRRFTALCDVLIWATTRGAYGGMPFITGRVYARDGGIDAEWEVEGHFDVRSVVDAPLATPIVGPGWNVWQYKLRNVASQDSKKITSELKQKLNGAIVDLAEKHGRTPDRYLLVVNLDLTLASKKALRDAIITGLDQPDAVDVQILDAGSLAVLLNDLPHIRASFFGAAPFETWQFAMDRHRAIHARSGWSEDLVGRDELLAELRSAVDNPSIRAIVVTGPPESGKSRLALAATRHRREAVVSVFDVRSVPIGELRALGHASGEVIVIVDEAAPESVEDLLALALGEPTLKLVVVVPSTARVTTPALGPDERIQRIDVPALDRAASLQLLEASAIELVPGTATWIVQHSGGLPGVLLAAATVGASPHESAKTLRQQVADVFKEHVRANVGAAALNALRVLAPLTFVGYRGDRFGNELGNLRELIAPSIDESALRELIDNLAQAGIVAVGGSFAHIAVPFLAEELAREWVEREPLGPAALLASESESFVSRFIDRIGQLDPVDTAAFWNTLLEPGGPLADFPGALAHGRLLRRAAVAVPSRVLAMLNNCVGAMDVDERLALAGNRRRKLVWTVESLLVHPDTSAPAVRLIWLLAEAENETAANNATGLLRDVFDPLHPYVPLDFAERLVIAERLFDAAESDAGRIALIQALGRPFGNRFVMLAGGDWPLHPFVHRTYLHDDLRRYFQERTALLFRWAEHPDPPVRSAAFSVLPGVAEFLVSHGMPEDGFAAFDRLIEQVRDGKGQVDAATLAATMRDVLERRERQLADEVDPTRRERFERERAAVVARLESLQAIDLFTRLQVWAGRWDHDETMAAHRETPAPFALELERIVDSLVAEPHRLEGEVLDWLLSPAAGKGMYVFVLLGRRDTTSTLLPTILAIASTDAGAGAFGAYVTGWKGRDESGARAALDRLARDVPSNVVRAIAYATVLMGPSASDVTRLLDLVTRKVGDAASVSNWLLRMRTVHRWVDGTTPEQFEALLEALARPDLRNADGVIALLSSWWHVHNSFTNRLQHIGRDCLTSAYAGTTTAEPWQHALVASHLAETDPEMGFDLFRDLMSREVKEITWEPFDGRYGHALWDVLSRHDKERLIRSAVEIARIDGFTRLRMTRALHQCLGDDVAEEQAILIAQGTSDVEAARIVAESLDHEHPDLMWPVAFALVEAFPSDHELLRRLADVLCGRKAEVFRSTMSFVGSYASTLADHRAEIESALESAPPAARQWLREVRSRLTDDIGRQIIWEYDEDVDDLRSYLSDPASPRRAWAVERVLKYADWKDARRLLSLDDIEAALPEIDLPEKKRRALEAAIPVWRSER